MRLMSACSPRPLWESGFADGAGETAKTATPPDSERIEPAGALLRRRNSESVEQIQDREEFQVELGRNLEILVRGSNNKKLPLHPITAPTSQVGEVAVVRTSVSYKCGWGSDNKKLPPRHRKTTSLRGNSHSTRSNPEQISQLKNVGCVKPNNNNMDCRVAPAPRNDIQLTHTPRPFGESGFADAGEGLKNYHFIQHPPLPPSGTSPARGADAATLN